MGTSIDRQLRANRAIILAPVVELPSGALVIVSPTGTTCPLNAPTSAVLEAWRAITTTSVAGASRGGNISGAVLDDVTLGFSKSDTDSELTIVSVGNEEDPLFAKVDITITVFRDRNAADTGVFNLATNLFKAPDTRYVVIDRIGYSAATAFASGQPINAFDVRTDNPVDVKSDRGNLKITQAPAFTGNFLMNYTLAS
jgi:hypothetical protein